MPHLPIPDKVINLNPKELELLQHLLDKEKEAVRTTLRATSRWTERLEQHTDLLADISEKLGS